MKSGGGGTCAKSPHCHVTTTSATMSTIFAPSRQVFEIPELLGLVCSYASHHTCHSILCTKKSGFLTATPFVWREIDRVGILLKLLPGIRVINKKSKNIIEVVSRIALRSSRYPLNHRMPRFFLLFPKPTLRGSIFMLPTSSRSMFTGR